MATGLLLWPFDRVFRSPPCILAIGIAMLLPPLLRAGGPRTIAGTSYFDPGVRGTPLTWNQGVVSYYTDRGNLSPVLPGPGADAFVADAFSRWTSISTAAVTAVRAGQLAEDVSGANVSAGGGIITLPADILPSAKGFPVAIVYDADGAVTNALLGQGAGSTSSCFSNAAYGGVDSFSTDAHLVHALVILNGVCAETSAQLPDMKYRLVRILGRVLGLDWSQMNVNVFTRSRRPHRPTMPASPSCMRWTRSIAFRFPSAIPTLTSLRWTTGQRSRACIRSPHKTRRRSRARCCFPKTGCASTAPFTLPTPTDNRHSRCRA